MNDVDQVLSRIAAALERLSPPPAETDWLASAAYVWGGTAVRAVNRLDAPSLDLLRGIDFQKETVSTNVLRLAQGHAAHDMLLWGARGMGKSTLLRSSVKAAQERDPGRLGLVQVAPEGIGSLADLFAELAGIGRNFLVFLDDLGFGEQDSEGPRHLRSWLEGGVEGRPRNVRLAVTSNRRVIVPRHASEQDDPINPRDAVDDKLALADRFGLSVGFHNCSQDDYIAIVTGYTTAHGLVFDELDALEWAKRRGSRSGRTAWQYVTELAGRAGVALY